MKDGLAADHQRYDEVPPFAIFPVRNTSFVEIENQFNSTSLDVFFQTLECSMEKRL
jgi:hypothetical protein